MLYQSLTKLGNTSSSVSSSHSSSTSPTVDNSGSDTKGSGSNQSAQWWGWRPWWGWRSRGWWRPGWRGDWW